MTETEIASKSCVRSLCTYMSILLSTGRHFVSVEYCLISRSIFFTCLRTSRIRAVRSLARFSDVLLFSLINHLLPHSSARFLPMESGLGSPKEKKRTQRSEEKKSVVRCRLIRTDATLKTRPGAYIALPPKPGKNMKIKSLK